LPLVFFVFIFHSKVEDLASESENEFEQVRHLHSISEKLVLAWKGATLVLNVYLTGRQLTIDWQYCEEVRKAEVLLGRVGKYWHPGTKNSIHCNLRLITTIARQVKCFSDWRS